MKKKEHGFSDQRTARDNILTVVRWHNNKAVYLASNVDGVSPVDHVQQWSREQNLSYPAHLIGN